MSEDTQEGEIERELKETETILGKAFQLMFECDTSISKIEIDYNDENLIDKLSASTEMFGVYSANISRIAKKIHKISLVLNLRNFLLKEAKSEDDRNNYSIKKWIVSQMNQRLKEHGMAIKHPSTGLPCNLYAVGSVDGKGKYVLEDRTTKKRSNASNSLADLSPIQFMDLPSD